MQYHLNGFKPGNYQISDSIRKPSAIPPILEMPKEVDVLIIGCGPAGLTMARQLSEFTDITTCIADLEDGPLQFGRADGISCRTIEIMEAFNSSEMIVKEAYQLRQNTFWEPDSKDPANIKRTHKVADARIGLSEFAHGIVNQARLHEILLEGMKNSVTGLVPHYSRKLVELNVDQNLTQDLDSHPITAKFELNDGSDSPKIETVKAKYIVGTDGARSSVRRGLSIDLKGDSANKAWGVMDLLLVTDFPDIRVKGTLRDWVRHAKFNVTQGKNFIHSGAIGPWMVSADEFTEEQFENLRVTTRVNGEVRQDDTTASMMFPFKYIISYFSKFFHLKPGDVIATGTPNGAGARFEPPRYLAPGDVVEIEVEDFGTLVNGVKDEDL